MSKQIEIVCSDCGVLMLRAPGTVSAECPKCGRTCKAKPPLPRELSRSLHKARMRGFRQGHGS